jgi:hypothetical protein
LGLPNVLKEEKGSKSCAVGQLGDRIGAIQQETRMHREIGSQYVKAIGIGVRQPGAWGGERQDRPTK